MTEPSASGNLSRLGTSVGGHEVGARLGGYEVRGVYMIRRLKASVGDYCLGPV